MAPIPKPQILKIIPQIIDLQPVAFAKYLEKILNVRFVSYNIKFRDAFAHRQYVVTGSIARSAQRRYLSYSQADFEVFAPHRRHVAPMG